MGLLREENPEPDLQTVKTMVERTRSREVYLLYFRFFNILMSRQKIKAEDSKVDCGLALASMLFIAYEYVVL